MQAFRQPGFLFEYGYRTGKRFDRRGFTQIGERGARLFFTERGYVSARGVGFLGVRTGHCGLLRKKNGMRSQNIISHGMRVYNRLFGGVCGGCTTHIPRYKPQQHDDR